jgi:hypothetical protein
VDRKVLRNRHKPYANRCKTISDEVPIVPVEYEGINYFLYKYDERDRTSSWGAFFPGDLIEGEDFSIQTTSFVLFCSTNSNLYCFIGGNAITVVKRYLNQIFGIDLYERISAPDLDIVSTITSRGISGNLNSQTVTFRREQKLIDALSLTRLPTKATILLREELIADVFPFLDVEDEDKVFIDIGSSFFIKSKLDFNQCRQLIETADDILQINQFTSLSAFERIRRPNLISNNLRPLLFRHLYDEMARVGPPGRDMSQSRLDFDFVHPSKLTSFYECDLYNIYERGAHQPFYTTSDRTSIYKEVLKYAYSLEQVTDLFSFRGFLSGVRVYGYRGDDRLTHAMFEDHITCETVFNNRPVFKIDSRWFFVKGDFISRINDQCLTMCRANYWDSDAFTKTWDVNNESEGTFNLKYHGEENFIVLDKCLGQNIELCDILYQNNTTAYLIHVKVGFDAKIRDLSNQILISSNRLWDDIKSGDYVFLDEVIDSYNNKDHVGEEIPHEEFREIFNKKIVFVMAFVSTLANGRTIIDNMGDIGSNIAKFSLIQSVREMNTERNSILINEIQR